MEYKASDGIYKRIGKCTRCPGPEIPECCIGCLHIKKVKEVWTCLIYDRREEVCEECMAKRVNKRVKVTHKVCINFPDHPFLHCLKSGKCGYKFIKEKK